MNSHTSSVFRVRSICMLMNWRTGATPAFQACSALISCCV